MHVLLFVIFILVGAPPVESWSAVFRRKLAVAAVTTFVVPFSAFAAVDEPTTSAISNVLRISYSLKNVDESIEAGSDVRTVVTQIKALVSAPSPPPPLPMTLRIYQLITHLIIDIIHILTTRTDA